MPDPAMSGLYALPLGVNFPRTVADGLLARYADQPPEALARVEVYVNTGRMQRQLHAALSDRGARLLPRLRLLSDLPQILPDLTLPPPPPPLRLRLELSQLVAHLLDREPDLAPRAAIYDLADSLATLLAEMQGEGVPPEAFDTLDLSEHSRHWERSQKFLRIVAHFFGPETVPAGEARFRRAALACAAAWENRPPDHPILIAGSTGSRGATALFMHAVARLPQGAVILPGFDTDMPARVWTSLDKALSSEDHPQYRYYRLCSDLGTTPDRVPRWHDTPSPSPDRNRVISLSLRPAPVTDQWMREGGGLPDLTAAMADVTLIEAQSPRAEAVAIALRLRAVADAGGRATLITPDRQLGRQVTAALDRWGIVADDSAGRPLALSPPGRFLRHVAALRGRRVTVDALLTLLKHPLTNSGGAARGDHLRWTRGLELRLRAHGPAFPTGEEVIHWASARKDEGLADWAEWVRDGLTRVDGGDMPLADHLAAHIGLAEAFARGPGAAGAGTLWDREAGIMARAVCDDLIREAEFGGEMSAFDYDTLFTAVLQDRPVRGTETVHPNIMIRGTIEARVTEADLVILGGLNDGIWPPTPAPDPWLNRQLRHQLGLLLPDRQIGLSAHDYQQAVTMPEIVLSRAIRDTEAQTVPSRWLNRLMNLLAGLPERRGPEALGQMRDRGQRWLRMAATLDLPAASIDPAPRPAPRPPLAARPRQLAVTGIQRLIRDPYAIYARYILRLKPLDPLHPGPDARLRGSVLHKILERFVQEREGEDLVAAKARLLAIADDVMADEIPWASAQRLWRARLARSADGFLALEAKRPGTPCLIEGEGKLKVSPLDFTLTAKPDRIDMLPDGRLQIFDYKTGALPTAKQQQVFDKQLLLEAAMAGRGAFEALGPCDVDRTIYVGLGGEVKEAVIEITDDVTGKVWEELCKLLAAYARAGQGYTSRRAVEREAFGGDYDHLARYGEWDMSDAAKPEDVG